MTLAGSTVVICEDDRAVVARAARTLRDVGFIVRAPLIVQTRDGCKMISAYETLLKIIRKAWAANDSG